MFNGKELDDETGLYYYGARYYDPRSSVFLGVDPLAEKYLTTSGYAYTLSNPILYSDPDGRDARVSVKGNTINVSTTIYIYGSGANQEVAEMMQANIMGDWSKDNKGQNWIYKDGDSSYEIIIDVKVKVLKGDPRFIRKKGGDNYIEVSKEHRGSSYVLGLGGNSGKWRGKGRSNLPLSKDDPSSHETGHLFGIKDYYENNLPIEGWEGNIMAEPAMKGKVDQRNINEMVSPVVDKFNDSFTKMFNDIFGSDIEYKSTIKEDLR
ncbi:hypothetical protein PEDI_55690 [Persicobacter diffluens]|uniref:RHS repeat-associated core domain-containing protein n=1 Tax=Persicobacter diffluens TaxID=981 RepID=A0AAN4W4K1_9BACT|nr:hypothetical protein PEDI_55690 [Persicobacter diffluens]